VARQRSPKRGGGEARRGSTSPGEARSGEIAAAQGPRTIAEADERADAVHLKLPTWEGPLDLLWHLIQEHQLDVLDIPIGFVTERYLEHLRAMQSLSIDVASEYLVMAATLAYIKSKMLLPPSEVANDDGDEEEPLDPREELVRRLLEYQKYKAASEQLGVRGTLGSDVFPRGESEPTPAGPAPFQPVGLYSLLDAFEKLLSRTKVKIEHQVVFDRISITERIHQLTDQLVGKRNVPFEVAVLGPAPEDGSERPALSRFDVVITFLAMLEMCKLRMLRVYQAGPLSPLYLDLVDDAPEAPPEGFEPSVDGGSEDASPLSGDPRPPESDDLGDEDDDEDDDLEDDDASDEEDDEDDDLEDDDASDEEDDDDDEDEDDDDDDDDLEDDDDASDDEVGEADDRGHDAAEPEERALERESEPAPSAADTGEDDGTERSE
jgi:segregation and condensation protein A